MRVSSRNVIGRFVGWLASSKIGIRLQLTHRNRRRNRRLTSGNRRLSPGSDVAKHLGLPTERTTPIPIPPTVQHRHMRRWTFGWEGVRRADAFLPDETKP